MMDEAQNFNDDWSPDDEDAPELRPDDLQVEPKQPPELITLTLLRRAIAAQNPNDEIMRDFGEYVLPNLLRVAMGVTAKGGKYFEQKEQEYLERQIREQRETIKPISRRSADDQSLNTHLLNGLFPANLIEQRLEELDTTIQRLVRPKPQRRRFGIAGFILHDFEKFDYNRFPSMPAEYKAVPKDNIRKLGIPAHREIIAVIIQELGLDRFLFPDNPEAYRNHIDDLLYIAYNAQRGSDTNLNTSEIYGLNEITLPDDLLLAFADLACLADLFASVIKQPQDAEEYTLRKILHSLSDGQLELSYHSISENHGVLTNVVNNAVMDEHTGLNFTFQVMPDDDASVDEKCKLKKCEYFEPYCHYYEPILYLPTGVIYLKHKNAPPTSIDYLPDRVIQKIKNLCTEELQTRQKGFVREGKGMKYAEYYDLFFNDIELMQIALKATARFVRNSKAGDRSKSLVEFQKREALSIDCDFTFSEDVRIDQLAEFGDLVTRKIWGSRIEKLQTWSKRNKQKLDLGKLESGGFLVQKIAEHWKLAQYLPQLREIQNINDRLKELKLKGNTGGLPLDWYYLAAQYFKHHSGCEDIKEAGEKLIECVKELISPILEKYNLGNDGWEDLREWVQRVVMLPSTQANEADKFLEELSRYNAAKQQRRGKQLICSITHSAYTVKEQMESAVLFTPQVYTNKQMLGGSNAKRNISSIAASELMLRQILMSETQEVGKKFEDGKYRYLYFYPTYYFTPETNQFLHEAYDRVVQTRFDTGVRNHFINTQLQADFSLSTYQTTRLFQHTTEENDAKGGRIFKLNYSENQPMTFYFMALPPEKRGKADPTDTESWVMPTWLAFAFPMILDVKTVVSESPIPPCTDGTDFEQTVFLDSAPQAIQTLTRSEYFRLDYILEGWEHNKKKYAAPLNVLTAAYSIHLDVNAKQAKGGYNPNWGRLAELARDFATSPLYVFSYLKTYTRSKQLETPGVPKIRLYAYDFYPCFDPYVQYDEDLIVMEQSPIHHPKKLTELYRKFYRAKSTKGKPTKANAILKPIDEAADVILKAEFSACRGETLVDYVAARLFSLMNRVHSSTAEGRWIFKNSERDLEREAIADFARYFVLEVFEGTFKGDRARLAGRQLNLIRDTCEYLYRLEDDKLRRAKQSADSETDAGTDDGQLDDESAD